MPEEAGSPEARSVLNVGGGGKGIAIPPHYEGWKHVLLDIDPRGGPDVVCDARELATLAPATYDALYCSHNLEHYFRHEVPKVLAGFHHVLKDDGFAEIRVPDLQELMRVATEKQLDLTDVLYQSPAGAITVMDVIYGFGVEIERSGSGFYAHKTGFTKKCLQRSLHQSGFLYVLAGVGNLEVRALAFKNKPTEFHQKLLDFSLD